MDYVCEKCGTLGWENELKNWHFKKTGCDGSIVPIQKMGSRANNDGKPDLCVDGELDKTKRPDRADVVVKKQTSPKQRWDREKYRANHREYMRKRRAK